MTHVTGASLIAGVVGRPVRHSLSPLLHNAWLQALGLDGVYVPLSPTEAGFPALLVGLRGSGFRGLNVTLPFKTAAMASADRRSARAARSGAANLLVFEPDGTLNADNTDGEGLIGAMTAQAGFVAGAAPVVVLGAGGAARGAAAALLDAGAPSVRLVNRTRSKAEAIAADLGEGVNVFDWSEALAACAGAGALVNATSLGLNGEAVLVDVLGGLPSSAVVMDMVYRPLRTPLLTAAADLGHPVVDGLEMLIRQAIPSFEALFGAPVPMAVDVRAMALAVLGEATSS